MVHAGLVWSVLSLAAWIALLGCWGPDETAELRVSTEAGWRHLASARPDRARESFREALASEPGHLPAHVGLGAVLASEARFDEAEEKFRWVLARDSNNFLAQREWGLALAGQGRLEEADERLGLALRLRPVATTAMIGRARVLSALNRSREALALFEQAEAAGHAMTASELAHFGACLERVGRAGEARARYEAALIEAPDDPLALNNLGIRLVRSDEQPARGRALLERAAAARPHDADVLHNLGWSYLRAGHHERAHDFMKRSLAATDPAEPAYALRLRDLESARVALPRRDAPEAAPNVALVVLDTVRAGHLGAYGYARATSPRIDAVAREGVVMEAAISQAPWTAPSIASIFTGLHPSVHGLDSGPSWGRRDAGGGLPFRVHKTLDSSHVTLAEILRDHGYETAGFVSNAYLNSIMGFAQGFDIYDDTHGDYSSNPMASKRRAAETNRRIFDWLGGEHQEPFFLLAHYNDAHWPYDPPAPFGRTFVEGYEGRITPGRTAEIVESKGRRIIGLTPEDVRYVTGLYDGEIQYLDDQVGKLLDRLWGRPDSRETLVIITSDHGEEFLEHGSASHGYTLYEEQLHVPLILHLPGRLVPRRVPQLVAAVDLLPTVLELVGIEFEPAVLQGRSFSELLEGEVRTIRTHVFSEATYRHELLALRSKTGEKVIMRAGDGSVEFYDLVADPKETEDLAGTRPKQLPALTAQLMAWRERNRNLHSAMRSMAEDSPEVLLDEQAEAQLRALGYID